MRAARSGGPLYARPTKSHMKKTLLLALIAFGITLPGLSSAQTAAVDPSDRLKEVLPPDVAERVLATIAEARARELPADALANRALKFAARGVDPLDIERSLYDHALRLDETRSVLNAARGGRASDEEVEAGSEALRMGADAENISELARSAPSGRSLAVPLFVLGSLVDRGLPADQALRRVLDRLQARATDLQLEQLPAQAGVGPPAPGVPKGQGKGLSNRPGSASGGAGLGPAGTGGRPVSLPPNPGKGQEKGKGPEGPPGQP